MAKNGITLTQGNKFFDPTTGKDVGTVQFDAQTGARLGAGQTTVQSNASSMAPIAPLAPARPATASQPSSTITSANTANNSAFNLPTTPLNPTVGNTEASNTLSDARSQLGLGVNQGKNDANSTLKDYLASIKNQSTDIQAIRDLSGQEQKRLDVQSVVNRDQDEERRYQKQVDQIRQNSDGKSTGAVNQELNDAQYRYNNNKANISIEFRNKSQDFIGTQNLVNEKISSLKESNSQMLSAYQLQVAAVNDDLTASEKVIVQNNLQQQAQASKLRETAYATVLQNAVQNNAPASVFSAIDTASKAPNATAASIFSAAGTFARETPATSPFQVSFDDNGKPRVFDPNTGRINGSDPSKVISTSTGAYDLSTYATDPNHGVAIQNIMASYGNLTNASQINGILPINSPLTGDMIMNTANEYKIDPTLLTALLQQESNLGTSNVARNNNNFGGITWNGNNGMKGTPRPPSEGGNYVRFATPQEGIAVTAQQIARRKVQGGQPNILSIANKEGAINQIDQLVKPSIGMASSVGTSFITRSSGLWGTIGKAITGLVAGVGGGALAGSVVPGVGTVIGGGVGAIIGVSTAIGRGTFSKLTGQQQDFIGGVTQITKDLTKDKLAQAKGMGITFGALSDGERDLIAGAATLISSFEIREGGKLDGRVIGYNASEKSFRAELNKINNLKRLDYVLQGGTPESVGIQIMEDGSYQLRNTDGTISILYRQ